MNPSTILLKNGTLLLHVGPDDRVEPTKADLLILGNKIARIDPSIPEEEAQDIIDCAEKIISPGFIDGHQHVWQAQLKGRHADHSFVEYMPRGNLQSANYAREDIFWGQLGGCLELLDAGTTMVVDHAHVNTSPESSATAISATVTSGIRSIFCYTPINPVASWNPLTFSNSGMLAPWVIQTFSSLASRAPFGPNGRVALGLAFDGWFLPAEAASPLFAEAKKHGVELLTGHMTRGVLGHLFSLPALLAERGLLGGKKEGSSEYAPFKTVLLSHSTGATSEDLAVLKQHGAHIASTPGTELQMGLGRSVCFDDEACDIACLGGDCLANGGSSIVGEMRLGLQAERAQRNQRILDKGLAPRKLDRTVEQAFNLGTIKGARAAGMADKLGSLAVGKLADLVVFDGSSPSMVCAAQQDPVAAIVLHSNPRDISTVIVDGVVRKKHGQLVDMGVDVDSKKIVGKGAVGWNDVARELLKSRETIQKKVEEIDFTEAQHAWMKSWYIDPSKIVDLSNGASK